MLENAAALQRSLLHNDTCALNFQSLPAILLSIANLRMYSLVWITCFHHEHPDVHVTKACPG